MRVSRDAYLFNRNPMSFFKLILFKHSLERWRKCRCLLREVLMWDALIYIHSLIGESVYEIECKECEEKEKETQTLALASSSVRCFCLFSASSISFTNSTSYSGARSLGLPMSPIPLPSIIAIFALSMALFFTLHTFAATLILIPSSQHIFTAFSRSSSPRYPTDTFKCVASLSFSAMRLSPFSCVSPFSCGCSTQRTVSGTHAM